MKNKLTALSLTLLALSDSHLAHAKLPADYSQKSALEKQTLLWNNISSDPYVHLPTENPSTWQSLSLMAVNFLVTTFQHSSDEMPVGRPKLIHTYGSTAKVRFEINRDSPYTGLFKTGGIGVARLSLAAQGGSFTPGLALKIFIDRRPSVNFQVMYALEGQGEDRNFFKHSFTNVIANPESSKLKFLAYFFGKAIDALSPDPTDRPEEPTNLPLYEAAKVNTDGTEVRDVVEPYVLVLIPNPRVAIDSTSKRDFREDLGNIPENTLLYQVALKRTKDSAEEIVGQVVTQSEFVASKYGDEGTFYQHQSHRRPGL